MIRIRIIGIVRGVGSAEVEEQQFQTAVAICFEVNR